MNADISISISTGRTGSSVAHAKLAEIQKALDATAVIVDDLVVSARDAAHIDADIRDAVADRLIDAADATARIQHDLLCRGCALLADLRDDLDVVAPRREPALHQVIRDLSEGKQLSPDAEHSLTAYGDLRTALESPDGYTNVCTDFSVQPRDA